jgi:hypothetical protein
MKFLLPVIVLFATFSVDAQVRKFRWSTELCEFEGTYDGGKYNETLLKNTQRLLSPSELRLDSGGATVWKYEEISKLDVAALDANYTKLKAELETLKFVKNRYTESVRLAKLNEAKQLYELSRTTILAYNQPVAIRDYSSAAACKRTYGEPLIAGGDDLLTAWRKVNEDSRKKNADPDRLKRIFDEQSASPDKFKYALVETMSFGWWNCANNSIEYSDIGQGETPEKEFKKLFIRVRTIRCDEP